MRNPIGAAVLVLSAFMLFGCADNPANINSGHTVSSAESSSSSISEDRSDEQMSNMTDISAEGGDPGDPENFSLEITISEDKYFVDDHEITFEELKSVIGNSEKGSSVKIYDKNSTLKAFNAVKNYLAEKEITYSFE